MRGLLMVACIAVAMLVTWGTCSAWDLTGEWTEVDTWGAREGLSDHMVGDDQLFLSTESPPFSLKITEQSEDKRGFRGEWCSASTCEKLVGAVRSDGSLLMVDEDGFFDGRLLGSTMELCYREAKEAFHIVSCRIMTRK